ncbi:MAG: DinB family protein [Gemmatimonadetes bacterium]|nr:DinB family protein [Gemmatimonadota bacterium]
MTHPDSWLRGPVPGIDPMLQPAAHSLLHSREELDRLAPLIPADALWTKPGGAASIGWHLKHLAGSTDRLMSYARGEQLSDEQKARLTAESHDDPAASVAELLARAKAVLQAGLVQLEATATASLTEPRAIGRAQLPTTVIGCLFHAAEHAYRHVGQLATTIRQL